LPETEIAADQVISLPVHPALTQNDLDHIINTFGKLLE
jgi:perosamine synthetase